MHNYNSISKAFHWVIALLILALLSVGFYMHGMDFSPFKLKLYGWHKSFGIMVLGLAALRILWRFVSKPPGALTSHAKWEKVLSKAAHVILYVALFAMPLSGWIMSSAGGFPAAFFGLELPALSGKDEGLFELMKEVHEILAFVIIGVVGLHMAGAFKHHFIDKDETLRRMSSSGLGFVGGAVLAVIMGGLLLLPVSMIITAEKEHKHEHEHVEEAKDAKEVSEALKEIIKPQGPIWNIDHEKSYIKFVASQYGQSFEGEFTGFDGQIFFNPGQLEQNTVSISIPIKNIKTGSEDRDKQAISEEWFWVDMYPEAGFVVENFESVGSNRYIAHAILTIRGMDVAVDMLFTLEILESEDGITRAYMNADLSLDRLDFGVGQGQWQSTEAIGNAVKIRVYVEALKDKGDLN